MFCVPQKSLWKLESIEYPGFKFAYLTLFEKFNLSATDSAYYLVNSYWRGHFSGREMLQFSSNQITLFILTVANSSTLALLGCSLHCPVSPLPNQCNDFDLILFQQKMAIFVGSVKKAKLSDLFLSAYFT